MKTLREVATDVLSALRAQSPKRKPKSAPPKAEPTGDIYQRVRKEREDRAKHNLEE